jgi:hypothetical protein
MPECNTEDGCALPELHPDNHRIIEMYNRIGELAGLVDAGVVLKMYDATIEDLELLASIKRELSPSEPPKGRTED